MHGMYFWFPGIFGSFVNYCTETFTVLDVNCLMLPEDGAYPCIFAIVK